MNIRDAYIHGIDLKGVIKNITLSGSTLTFTRADASGTTLDIDLTTIKPTTTGTADKVTVSNNTTSTSNYNVVWDNGSNQLYHSSGEFYYNPAGKILTASGGFNGGSLVITGNSSLQDISGTTLNISGTSTFSSPINGDLLGNSTTTDRWKNKRTITIGNTGKSVDGSADVSWTLAEIGALAAGSYKTTQTAVSSSTSDGSGTTFVSSVTLNTNGVITVKTKSLDTSGTWSGKATTAGTADLVANSLVLKMASGTTEGKDLYTFNGSAGKTINFVAGTGISFTTDASGNFTITNSSPDLNHNTDRYVNSAKFEADTTNNNILMTLTRAGSDLATVTANIPVFGGASSSAAGTSGLVKVPTKGQQGYYLRGDCTWQSISTTDTNVTQTATDSTNATYEILFSSTADNTTRTEGARKTQYLTYNPSTKLLTLSALTASGTVNLNGTTSIDSATIGNLTVSGASTLTGDVSMGTVKQGVWNGTRLTSSYIPTDVVYTGSTLTLTNKTMSTGCTWNGNSIANTYITNHSITIAGTSVDLGGSITAATIGSALTSSAPAAYATTAAGIDGYTFKTLTKANDSDYASDSADAKIIPTMSFIAYWNGAYNDSGSSNITKVGTISKGTWQGTAIANSYLANSKVTIAGTDVSLGGSISADTLKSNLGLGSASTYAASSFFGKTLISANADCNSVTDNSFTILNLDAESITCANKPSGASIAGGYGLLTVTHGTYRNQIFFPYSRTGELFIRSSNYDSGVSYGDWYKFIHSGNYTSYINSTTFPILGKTPTDVQKGIDAYNALQLANSDVSGTVDRWDEVVHFLSTITESDTLASILLNYVTVDTAQTITGSKTFSNPISGDLLGNATTVDRLKNARTINGVSFDGSANITITAAPNSHSHGNITNAGAIGSTAGYGIFTGTSGVLTAYSGVYWDATNNRLGIGTTSPDYKLDVNGNSIFRVEGNLSPSNGASFALGYSFNIVKSTETYGLHISIESSGKVNLQSSDLSINYYILALNPLGGDVTINGNIALHAGNYSSYNPILNSASTHATSSSVIYAPTSVGTSGQVLVSSGSGAPSWTNTNSLGKVGDADTVDSKHASDFVTIAGDETITGYKLFKGDTVHTTDDTVRMPIKVALNSYADSGHNVAAIGFANENTRFKGFFGYERTGSYDKGQFVIGLNTADDSSSATYSDIKFKFNNDGNLTATTFTGNLIGNADTVTNGVYTTGTQTISGNKTFSGATTIDSLTAGNLVVNGASSLTGDVSLGTVKLGTWLGTSIDTSHGGTAGETTANKVLLSTTTSGTTSWSGFMLSGTSGTTYNLATIASNASAGAGKTSANNAYHYIVTGTYNASDTTAYQSTSSNFTANASSNVYTSIPLATQVAKASGANDNSGTNTWGVVKGCAEGSTGEGSWRLCKVSAGQVYYYDRTNTSANVSTPSEAITLVTDTNYSLSTASWQTGPSMTSYSGTYAISIKDSATNTNYYTGLIILNGSTGRNAVEEIPLFSCMATSSDSDTPTRIFAGMKQGVLLLSSQDANGTNHKLTIKILKLIAI